MRKIEIENTNETYTDDNAGLMAASSTETFEFEHEAKTFDEYTQKVNIFLYFNTIIVYIYVCIFCS